MAGHMPLFPFGEITTEEVKKSSETYFGDEFDISPAEFIYNIETILKGANAPFSILSIYRSRPFKQESGVSETVMSLPVDYTQITEEENSVELDILKKTLKEEHGDNLKFSLGAYSSEPKKYRSKRVGVFEVHYLLVENTVSKSTFFKILQIYYVA